MRGFFILVCSLATIFVQGQNFVSPGIIAFHSGAYERTIQDMDKAFETTPDMDNDMRSKAHYYRGMARLKLIKAGNNSAAIGRDPYLSIYNDLSNASRLDNQWKATSDKELGLIFSQLVNSSKKLYDEGIYAETDTEIEQTLGFALTKLNTALQVNNTFEVNELLGKTHEAIGTYYDQYLDNTTAQNKALESYRNAFKHYEVALTKNNRSLSCIKSLKFLAYRLGDRQKEIEYERMESNIGG